VNRKRHAPRPLSVNPRSSSAAANRFLHSIVLPESGTSRAIFSLSEACNQSLPKILTSLLGGIPLPAISLPLPSTADFFAIRPLGSAVAPPPLFPAISARGAPQSGFQAAGKPMAGSPSRSESTRLYIGLTTRLQPTIFSCVSRLYTAIEKAREKYRNTCTSTSQARHQILIL